MVTLPSLLARAERVNAYPRIARAARHPVRALRITYADRRRVPHRVVARLFTGDRMYVYLPEPVSRHLYLYGYYELGLTAAFVSLIRPGDVFVDIGAHFGYYSILASRLVGPTGAVYSFEPIPGTYAVLQANLASRPETIAVNAAVGSERGSDEMTDMGLIGSGFNASTSVPLRLKTMSRPARISLIKVPRIQLDSFFSDSTRRRPTFVKIDAESSEESILAGMVELLRIDRPAVTVEVGDVTPGVMSRRVVDQLHQLRYRAFEWGDGTLIPHEPKNTYEYGNLMFIHETSAVLDRLPRRAAQAGT